MGIHYLLFICFDEEFVIAFLKEIPFRNVHIIGTWSNLPHINHDHLNIFCQELFSLQSTQVDTQF
jgi:hypothetical protein